MRHYRFGRQREDAADGCEMICNVTPYSYLHCPHCHQRQYGEIWDNCFFCNRPMKEERNGHRA